MYRPTILLFFSLLFTLSSCVNEKVIQADLESEEKINTDNTETPGEDEVRPMPEESLPPKTVANFPLPENHFLPAKMNMVAVYPRPIEETKSSARHLHAYPGIEYRIPIVVQGGAWPFYYEIIEGPENLKIGNLYGEDDYGILSWIATGEGQNHAVKIKVTDQEQNSVNLEWSISTNKTSFIFVDTNAINNGNGSFESPYNVFFEIHKDNIADTSQADKIIYLRGGTHLLTGPAANNGNLQTQGNNKPTAWLNYPGEEVNLDMSNSSLMYTASAEDIFIGGINFINANANLNNARFIFLGSNAGARSTFFEINMKNLSRGLVGNDNPAGIVKFSGNQYVPYLSIHSVTIDDYSAPLIDMYATQYGVIENCILKKGKDAIVNQGIFLKGGNDYWSVRGNYSLEQDFGQGAIQHFLQDQGLGPQRIEVAYNFVKTSPGVTAIEFQRQRNETAGNTIWIYRNTVQGKLTGVGSATQIVNIENNLILSDASLPISSGVRVVNESNNITDSYINNIIDESLSILTPMESQYLGTHGAQIN